MYCLKRSLIEVDVIAGPEATDEIALFSGGLKGLFIRSIFWL